MSLRKALSDPRNDENIVQFHDAYLSQDVKIEPLVDSWHAWPHLLAPAQQALNLAYRYLPIVKSFVRAPSVHLAAAADPSMFGGPFLDLPVTAIDAAKAYIAEVEFKRTEALKFASEFRKLETTLLTYDGYSLDKARETAPDTLRGRIELAYNLNNHPKIRILEEMLQEDDLAHRSSQELLLHRTPDTARQFFLSTPRLDVPNALRIRTHFNSEAAQMLAGARTSPVNLDELAKASGSRVAGLLPFFTEGRAAPAATPYTGDGIRVSYFGHAAVLIETSHLTILIDPVLAYDQQPEGHHLRFQDLPDKIDVLLISHGHQDHFCPEILIQIRERVGLVVVPPSNTGELADPSLERMLKALGYSSIKTLPPLESIETCDGRITALPFSGEHCDLDVHAKQCLMLELKGKRLCFFVDSDAVDLDVYRRIASRLSDPDLMLIGMECFGAPLGWLYGPLISGPVSKRNDASRRLSGANCQRAWHLTQLLHPARVFVYAMGQEPWMKYLMGLNYREDSVQLKESTEFVERCRASGITAEHLYLHKVLEL
jgi:L-ascorbate metabolism protein UlaG (beta-lactamase superfamily)